MSKPEVYRGQSDVMAWCGGVTRAAVSNWFKRFPDEVPQPDVTIVSEGSDFVTRGWLPERRAEWEAFAAARKASGGERASGAVQRARSTAAQIEAGVADGTIDPAVAVKLLAGLIGRPAQDTKDQETGP